MTDQLIILGMLAVTALVCLSAGYYFGYCYGAYKANTKHIEWLNEQLKQKHHRPSQ